MANILESIFPKLIFTGAFLTPELREAFVIPLLQEATIVGKDLDNGKLYVQIENGHTYVASGDLFFGNEKFRVSIEVRRADEHAISMNNLGTRMPRHTRLPDNITIPSIFSGIGGEKYCLGIVNVCDRI